MVGRNEYDWPIFSGWLTRYEKIPSKRQTSVFGFPKANNQVFCQQKFQVGFHKTLESSIKQ